MKGVIIYIYFLADEAINKYLRLIKIICAKTRKWKNPDLSSARCGVTQVRSRQILIRPKTEAECNITLLKVLMYGIYDPY